MTERLTTTARGTVLAAIFGLLGLVALLAPSEGAGPLGPGEAEAAKCPGGDHSPQRLSRKRARNLVVCLVNQRRSKAGARPVKARSKLVRAATGHTKQMKRSKCFAHVCPGEPDLTGRLKRADYLPCNCGWGIGESIAYGKGRSNGSPRAVVRAWMRSAPHRKTLLDRGFEHAGVGFRRGTPYGSGDEAATYTIDFGFKR